MPFIVSTQLLAIKMIETPRVFSQSYQDPVPFKHSGKRTDVDTYRYSV